MIQKLSNYDANCLYQKKYSCREERNDFFNSSTIVKDSICGNPMHLIPAPNKTEVVPLDSIANIDVNYTAQRNSYEGSSAEQNCLEYSRRSEESERLKNVQLWEIVCLTALNFPYGLICGMMGLYILPSEAQRLFPEWESVMLGISLGIVGISQLVCPIAGRLSDMWPAQNTVARRSPFILYGTICGGLSVVGMWIMSVKMLGWLYYGFLFSGMVSLNIIYSVQCGFVPDLMNDEIQGKASGVVAVSTIGGSGTGFLIVMLLNQQNYHYLYPLCFICLVIPTVLSLAMAYRLQTRACAKELAESEEARYRKYTATETPETVTPRSGSETESTISYRIDTKGNKYHQFKRQIELLETDSSLVQRQDQAVGMSFRELLNCYKIDFSNGYDFFWVFVGRTFYYFGVSIQAFLLYYIRDVIGISNPNDRKLQVGIIAVSAQTLAALVAYPMGRWSDSENVNKKLLIYAACSLMTLTYFGFMWAPLFGKWSLWFVLIFALLYGVGNGCFLAVDYGIALATLPSKESAAQALGIWGVSGFIGSAIGPLLWGYLINIVGSSSTLPKGEYLYRGYLAMLWGGVIVTALAAWSITLIKKAV